MTRNATKRFTTDEAGAITPFMLVLMTGLLLMTGIALDLVRHEGQRADLQDALDRGVLAAASLTQTQQANTVVREYLDRRALSDHPAALAVTPSNALNARRVDAEAAFNLNTFFLRMVGNTDMGVLAASAAEHRREDVEISLVLDISGSMARERTGGTQQSRLEVLRSAASSFIDLVLAPENLTTTTVSLVPYAGQVNAGPFFDVINNNRIHTYASSCIDFVPADFNNPGLPVAAQRNQVPHFQWFTFEGSRGHEADWGWCPSDNQSLLPLSNDPSLLKTRISNLRGHDGTGTQIGFKWGLGLLDPSLQSLIADPQFTGSIDPQFANRPVAFNEPNSIKVIVVMTDGNIRYQQRPKPSEYQSNSQKRHLANNNLSSSKSTLDTGNKRLNDEIKSTNEFGALCDLAKQNGIIVFTIGFDVATSSPAYTEMRDCASSEGHFYHVNGLDLANAFRVIASTIQKLKLVE